MIVTYDVIFSVIAGLPKVYPNILDVPHSVFQQCKEKLRAPLMHTGTPSAYSLIRVLTIFNSPRMAAKIIYNKNKLIKLQYKKTS